MRLMIKLFRNQVRRRFVTVMRSYEDRRENRCHQRNLKGPGAGHWGGRGRDDRHLGPRAARQLPTLASPAAPSKRTSTAAPPQLLSWPGLPCFMLCGRRPAGNPTQPRPVLSGFRFSNCLALSGRRNPSFFFFQPLDTCFSFLP